MPEWVRVVHPSSPDAEPAVVTKEAFEEVHKANGWRLAPKTGGPVPAGVTVQVGEGEAVLPRKSKSTKKAR